MNQYELVLIGFIICLNIIFTTYLAAWFILSLIAKSEVAKLINEVISTVLTIIFTDATYIIGIVTSKYPSVSVIANTYSNINELERTLEHNNQLQQSLITEANAYFNYYLKLRT